MKRNGKETVKMMWNKVTRNSTPYRKMDNEKNNLGLSKKSSTEETVKIFSTVKPQLTNEQNGKNNKKEKKKRKGWKKFRHAALVTCRYIGIGVSYMSPLSTCPPPDYDVDPYNSRSSGYRPPPPVPHWTTGIILNTW